MTGELHYQTITELASRIESKAVSPVEVTEALLERIEAIDGRLKAYATAMADRAMEQARVAEGETRPRVGPMVAPTASGCYPRIVSERSWSRHNPTIWGEFARPSAYRWYLSRELRRLIQNGATIRIESEREVTTLDDASLLERIDENEWNLNQKKLFLFAPERVELSIERLEHYTGSDAALFQRYVLLTNYQMHMNAFEEKFPDCHRPAGDVQMPAYHYVLDDTPGAGQQRGVARAGPRRGAVDHGVPVGAGVRPGDLGQQGLLDLGERPRRQGQGIGVGHGKPPGVVVVCSQ